MTTHFILYSKGKHYHSIKQKIINIINDKILSNIFIHSSQNMFIGKDIFNNMNKNDIIYYIDCNSEDNIHKYFLNIV